MNYSEWDEWKTYLLQLANDIFKEVAISNFDLDDAIELEVSHGDCCAKDIFKPNRGGREYNDISSQFREMAAYLGILVFTGQTRDEYPKTYKKEGK